ncbi:MAG: hypothetical protein ACLRX0_02870 [Collinsella aerofaciens]
MLRPDYADLVLAQVGWTALCERELTADDYENEALPTLIDASCAGGGLLLEAVNILTDRAPGAARERWGFEGWQLHDAALWEQLLAEAREREAAARERQARIVADIDPPPARLPSAWPSAPATSVLSTFVPPSPPPCWTMRAPSPVPPWSQTSPRPCFRSCTTP